MWPSLPPLAQCNRMGKSACQAATTTRDFPIIPTRVLSSAGNAQRGPSARKRMNLTTDSWIPIVCKDGQPGRVSLCEAFERGEEIRDLALRPHERIALMRLLICIAQA